MKSASFARGLVVLLAGTIASACGGTDAGTTPPIALGAEDVQVLRDPEHRWDPAGALAQAGWKPWAGQVVNLGYTRDHVWLRFTADNPGSAPVSRILEVDYPALGSVELWLPGRERDPPLMAGSALPFDYRPIDTATLAFPLELMPGRSEVLVRVHSETSLQVPMFLWTPQAFGAHMESESLLQGLFLGTLLIMVVYNLVLFVATRERAYLYYVGYVASFLVYQAFHHGYCYRYLWPDAPRWNSISGGISISLTLAFGALFADAFLELGRRWPGASRAMRGLAILGLINATVAPLVSYSLLARIASLIALLLVPLSAWAAVRVLRSGISSARYFLVAWAAFLAGTGLFALSKLGILPYTLLTENALQVGAVIEVVLLSLALADRIHKERAQRHVAELHAMRREEQALAMSRYMPEEIGARLAAGDVAALARTRRDVVVLCASPTGFLESLAWQSPELVARAVEEFVESMHAVALAHGGVTDRFVGARMSVLFGALDPSPLVASVEAAADMALVMLDRANALLRGWEAAGIQNIHLRLAVGIAAGPAMVGSFGIERRSEYTALGEPAVRAQKLAGVAIPGEVNLDDRAATALGDRRTLSAGPRIEYEPGVPRPTFRLGGTAASAALPEAIGDADTLAASSGDPRHLPQLLPGDPFDRRYRVVEMVGRGAMAAVFRVVHLGTGEERALKVIAGALREAHEVEQFLLEAQATSRIHHPHVVPLHDFGRSLEGHYYLAFAFIEGRSLAARLASDGPLEAREAVTLGCQVLAALDAAHQLGLVHRDVKPANIMIDAEGIARVTDFGLVLSSASDSGRRLVAGTPRYMSPEQRRGEPIDARSDLYSFAVTFHEMMTGVTPGDPGGQDRLPGSLAEIVTSCLATDPARRPASAAALLAQLQAWAQERAIPH